jgi:hypothetical protein
VTIKMIVNRTPESGRRYGGRSKFAGPTEWDNRKRAIQELRNTFGEIHNQPDDKYLEDLARVGIQVEFEGE